MPEALLFYIVDVREGFMLPLGWHCSDVPAICLLGGCGERLLLCSILSMSMMVYGIPWPCSLVGSIAISRSTFYFFTFLPFYL